MYTSELLEQAKRILTERGLLRPADDEMLTDEIKRLRGKEFEDKAIEVLADDGDQDHIGLTGIDKYGYDAEDRAAFRKQVERALRYRG